MAEDSKNGAYVSYRNTDGWLFSSQRDDPASAYADVKSMVEIHDSTRPEPGPAVAQEMVDAVFHPENSPATTEPVATVTAPSPPQAASSQEKDSPAFDTCTYCGAVKNKWKDPGRSASGKPYPGFWSCPNYDSRTHGKG